MADDREMGKRAVAARVAEMVQDGMALGIGTGSTASLAIEAIARRIRAGELQVSGVPTSFASERAARAAGVSVTTFDEVDRLDLAFDGADEVDPRLDLIKGRGGAMTREKVVARQANRFVVLVDDSKLVETLGVKAPVPVEVLPMAVATVERLLQRLGARTVLRMGENKDGPVVTDQGFWIIDAHFDGIDAVHALDHALSSIPGVLDHGLFVEMATDVLVGREDGSTEHLTR